MAHTPLISALSSRALLLAGCTATLPVQSPVTLDGTSWVLLSLVLTREGASEADLRDMMQRAIGTDPTQFDVTPLILSLLGRGDR